MTTLSVTLVGFKENEEWLKKVANLDLTRWFKDQATPIVRDRLREIIDKGVDRPRWSPLHPFTKMHKEGRKVMVESERLIRSVTELTSDSIYKVSKDELEIGSKLPYAGIQNFGGEIRVTPQMRAFLHWKGLHLKATTDKITIPARPFLFVSRTMEQMLNNSLVTYIQGYIRQLQRGD